MKRIFKMELLAYVRVSTQQQKKDGTHETQMAEITKWADYKGHKIIKWYTDLAISGAEVKGRPRFIEMKKDIKTLGEGVVAFRLSRFARSILDLLMFVKEVTEEHKKSFFCVRDQVDTTTPQGRFFLQVMGALAELNREVIRENTELGRRRAKEEGRSLGGPKPKELNQRFVVKELKKGNSPERIGRLLTPAVSGSTVRRRMEEWGIYLDYKKGVFYSEFA